MRRPVSPLKNLIKSLTVILPLAFWVAACAPADHHPKEGSAELVDDGDPAAPKPAAGDSSDSSFAMPDGSSVDAIFAQANLDCSGGACPPALAMSMAISKAPQTAKALRLQVDRCTAFLVDRDVVATNAHCLPDDLRKPNVSCSGRMAFIFGTPAETIACDKVLAVSQPDASNLAPDYAFLHLAKPMTRAPLKLSRAGLADEQPYTVYSLDPTSAAKSLTGIFRSQTCLPKQNSLMTPQFTTDFADVAALACVMRPGNSGSPVIAADGTVRALLHALRTKVAYKNLDLPAKFDPLAFATNISCVEALPGLGEKAASCSTATRSISDLVRERTRSAKADYVGVFQDWRTGEAPKMLQFSLNRSSNNAHQSAIPTVDCMKSPEQWLAKSKDELAVAQLDVKAAQVKVSFNLPLWGIKGALDADERVSGVSAILDTVAVTLSFDSSLALKKQIIHASRSMISQSGMMKPKNDSVDIPFCQ